MKEFKTVVASVLHGGVYVSCSCFKSLERRILIPYSRSVVHENPAPRNSLVAIPNTIGFSFPILHPCPTFGESHFTGSSQISYSVSVLPNPATYCAQISDSGNDVPDPDVYYSPPTVFCTE